MPEPTESTDAATSDEPTPVVGSEPENGGRRSATEVVESPPGTGEADAPTDTATQWIPVAMRGPRTASSVTDEPDWGGPAPQPASESLPSFRADGPEAIKDEIEQSLAERIAGIEGRLQRAQAELAERQAEILTTLGEVRKELRGEIEGEIDALREGLAAQGRSLDEIVESIRGLQAGVLEKQTQGMAEIQAVFNDLAVQKPRIVSLEQSRSEATERHLEQEQELTRLATTQETDLRRAISAVEDRLSEREAALDLSAQRAIEAVESQRSGIVEKLNAVESRLAAEADRLASRGDAEERARRVSEERITAVVNELRERLQIQSERLTESEEAARERAAGFDRSLDATVAGVRGEIDEAHKRTDLLREELATLGDATTAKLAELGARRIPSAAENVTPLRSPELIGAASRSIPDSLDSASFEELRSAGLSVTQAARFIAYRNSLERPLIAADLDRVAGLQDELRETLKQTLDH